MILNKKILKYLIPPIVIDCALYLKTVLTFFNCLFEVSKNKRFKNIKEGRSVFILANGPSLNNFDIKSLYDQDVIVMNHFELADWKDKVSIVAHCIGEPLDWPAWEDPTPMLMGTDSESYWFHVSAQKEIRRKYNFVNKDINYIFSSIQPALWRNGAKINLSKPTLSYQSSSQIAIMVAIYMGYKKIQLIGFDNDWLSERNISPHFYEERDNIPKANLSKLPYIELIKVSINLWDIYIKLKTSAERAGVHIVNLSRPTFLDVFDYN